MGEEDTTKREPGLLVQEAQQPDLTMGELLSPARWRTLNWSAVFWHVVEILKPEFMTRRKHATRVGKTAYLDGLRGAAAFTVCLMHLTVYTHTDLELCYGQLLPNGKPNDGPAAWPIIRIPFTGGHFSVMLFFCISGYVVPRRLVSLLHEGRREEFVESVHSALVRRPFRLYLPVMWSTLFLCLFMGHIVGLNVPFPHYQSNIIAEAYNWVLDMMLFLNFFRNGPLFTWYNFHTWTLPVELRGSLYLFIWLFALHRLPTRQRVLLTAAAVFHLSIGSPAAWYACFFAGMLTSELDMLVDEGEPITLPWDSITRWFRRREFIRQFVLHLLLLVGLYFASQPSSDGKPREEVMGECPGWITLNWLMPTAYKDGPPNHVNYRWFYYFWGAWFTLIAVKEIPWVRWIFESSAAQYLGRHSFALYLVHGPMIGIYSERLFYLCGVKNAPDQLSFQKFGGLQNKWSDASWWPFPDGMNVEHYYPGLEPNFLVTVALSLPVFLYVAEIGTKVFDTPSISVSSAIWKKVKALR